PKMTDRDSIVDVAFQIQEGNRSRIANLAITGNTRTKENVIRREASVYPGDTFRRSTLMRTQRDIFGLGFFQDVTVDYEPTAVSIGGDVFNTSRDLDFYTRKDVGGSLRVGRPLRWPDYTRGIISYDLRDVTLSNFSLPRAGEPANLASLRTTKWPRRVSSVTL